MTEATTLDTARRAMIDSQLRTSGVNEPWVLAAMSRVPRENYLPAEARASAYIDRAVPLGEGRFLAAPLVQGKMLAEAKPSLDDKVLLVGDAGGYLAALLGPLCGSLDCASPAECIEKSQSGDYTLIIVDGAAEELPEALCARLADDGRLVTGLVQRGVTRLATGRKAAGEIALFPLAEMGIPVLAEFAAPKRWSF